MVEGPELDDFIEAHKLAGRVSDIRTPGFRQSTEDGIRKLAGIVDEAQSFDDPYEMAAFVLIETINKHAFNDGNHRTAWIVAKQALRKNKETMHVENIKSLDEIERDLRSEVKFRNVGEVSNWLQTGDFK